MMLTAHPQTAGPEAGIGPEQSVETRTQGQGTGDGGRDGPEDHEAGVVSVADPVHGDLGEGGT